MNEAEIRERLNEAVGETTYPEDLPSRVESRLKEPRKEQSRPRALGLVAAFIAIAIVAALVAPRLLTHRTTQLPVAPQASPQESLGSGFPEQDLAAAHLTGLANLVTPLHLAGQSGTRRIELIGAYADSARMVLFFRTPDFGCTNGMECLISASVNDAYGFLNASSSGGMGAPGDYVFALDAGPRPGADGIAQLKITVDKWTFSLALKVQPSTSLAGVPQRFALGSWKLTLEVVEATPSVVHVQAVIDGASVDQVSGPALDFAVLSDPSGRPVAQVAGSASVTVPKQQLNSSTYLRTRINDQWQRPTTAGTYQLRFQGGGGTVKIPLEVTAPNASPKEGKGRAIQPTDFPTAQESLTLTGSLATTITTGRPSQCGAGGGPSGTVFAFATYFQVGETWYWLDLGTDPTVRQYTGPGTYAVPAWLYTVGPDGPGQVPFEGTAQLTITSDRAPDTGSVEGTLTGLEVIAPQSQVTVSGTWTCTWGPNLGPG